MPETAIITGATGLLGRQVLKSFESAGYNAVGTGFSRATDHIRMVDIQNTDEVNKLFDEVKYALNTHLHTHMKLQLTF
jgi:S-adenosylmethionine synthetase